MTSEATDTIVPPATIVPPTVTDEAASVPMKSPEQMSPAERLAALRQKREDELAKAAERIDKQIAREEAKIKDDAEEAAMAEKRVALTTELKAFVSDTISNLAIVVPDTGMKLNPMIDIQRSATGEAMISITWPEKKASARSATAGSGTRAARGTSTDNRPATTKIDGLTGFKLPNGTVTKRPGDVLDAMGVSHAGDSAPRKLAAYARGEGFDKSNEIIAIVGDEEKFLGELVRETWPVTDDEADAAATAEAATATV